MASESNGSILKHAAQLSTSFQKYLLFSSIGVLFIAATLAPQCRTMLCIKDVDDLIAIAPAGAVYFFQLASVVFSSALLARHRYYSVMLLAVINIASLVGAIVAFRLSLGRT